MPRLPNILLLEGSFVPAQRPVHPGVPGPLCQAEPGGVVSKPGRRWHPRYWRLPAGFDLKLQQRVNTLGARVHREPAAVELHEGQARYERFAVEVQQARRPARREPEHYEHNERTR